MSLDEIFKLLLSGGNVSLQKPVEARGHGPLRKVGHAGLERKDHIRQIPDGPGNPVQERSEDPGTAFFKSYVAISCCSSWRPADKVNH